MSRRKLITIVTAVFIVFVCGCHQNTYHQLGREALKDSIMAYQDRARMGDSTAYLRMAELWLQDEDVERGTLWALFMASQAEEWGAVESWVKWGLSMPKYLVVHHVTEVLQDVAYHHFDDARAKGKRLNNTGFNPDWIETVIAMDCGEKGRAVSLCKRMIDDGSLMGRVLYCLLTNDKDSMMAVADELPMFYISLAEKARCEEQGNDPDELSENVPKYYLKADEHACLNRDRARTLRAYYEHLMYTDSLAVSSEEYARMKRLSESDRNGYL